ncbi:MAG: branched-chain amino acid ABC transporter permease [Patescibacteria group bacterium]
MEILPQLILNSIIAGSIYALLAMSFNLIFGATKFFNFAHGSFAVIGGYAVFYFGKTLGLPIYLAVVVGIAIAGLAGFIFDKIIYLPLRKRKSTNLVKLVASIGLFSVIQAIIAILFTSQFQTLSNSSSTQRIYQISTGVITQTQVVMFLSAVLILAALLIILKFTMFGKAINALSDDEEVAKIVGINTNKIISYVFLIDAGIAGWAGILVGYDTGIEPTMGLNLFLKGVIAAIVGGIGSVSGGLLGGFVLGFVENFGIWKISGEWKDAIAFGLLIIFLLFRPSGIIKK